MDSKERPHGTMNFCFPVLYARGPGILKGGTGGSLRKATGGHLSQQPKIDIYVCTKTDRYVFASNCRFERGLAVVIRSQVSREQ